MRLIDGDALKRKAQDVATEAWKMRIRARVETVLNQFIDWIDDAPTIKPKKGKWIIKDDTERFIAQCNCCRYIEDSRRIKNYCPNCGTDMREEENG